MINIELINTMDALPTAVMILDYSNDDENI
jgi:hypothetical protein